MWEGVEASGKEERNVLAWALLADAKASAIRARMLGEERGERQERGTLKKRVSDPPSSYLSLFIYLLALRTAFLNHLRN